MKPRSTIELLKFFVTCWTWHFDGPAIAHFIGSDVDAKVTAKHACKKEIQSTLNIIE